MCRYYSMIQPQNNRPYAILNINMRRYLYWVTARQKWTHPRVV